MVAFVCFPEAFAVVEAATVAANPATNMAVDTPSRVYRSSSVTPFFVVQSQCATPIDVVAIVGTNLRNRDTVRIRIGSSQSAVSGEGTATGDYTMPAWSGMKADEKAPMTVLRLPAPVMDKFVRIDIAATGHPDGYAQISRLVIGSGVDNEGIGAGSEVAINDASAPYTVAGMAYFDQFPLGQSFKASIPYINDRARLQKWQPMLIKAGITRAVLFVPDYELRPVVNMLADPLNQSSSWTSSGALSWSRNVDYGVDGSLTASLITDSSTSAAYYVKAVTIPTDAVPYCGSVYVKKAANAPIFGMLIEMTGTNASTSTSVFVDPATGRTNPATQVVDAGDYWRIWRPVTNSNGNATARLRVYPAHAGPSGNPGTSDATATGSNTFWGAQMTAGNELLDWTPSSSAATMDTHYGAMQQNDAVFGFITKSTPVKMNGYDYNSLDLTVTSIVL